MPANAESAPVDRPQPATTSTGVGAIETSTRSWGESPTASEDGSCAISASPASVRHVHPRDRAEEADRDDRGRPGSRRRDRHRLRAAPSRRPSPSRVEPDDRRDRRPQHRTRRRRTPWPATLLCSPTNAATNGDGGPFVELDGRRDLLEATGVHDADPVGDGERLLLVVGDEQGGGADLDLDPADLVAQLDADLGVERRERLVEEQHRRLDRERAGQRDPLLLATGELAGRSVAACSPSPTRSSMSPARVRRAAAVATAQLEAEGDVVDDRQVREQAVGLEHHPHVALVRRHPGHVATAHRHRAGGGAGRGRRGSAARWSCRSRTGRAGRPARRARGAG